MEPPVCSLSVRLGFGIAALLLLGALALAYQLHLQSDRYRTLAIELRARGDELVDFMLFELRDELAAVGRLDLLEQPARKALAYLEAPHVGAGTREARHRRGVALDNIAEVLLLRGDLHAARKAFQESLEIAEHLVRVDPLNPTWQRSLAIAHSKIGDLRQEEGNLSGASEAQRKALDIFDRLMQQEPEDRERLYDLAVAHERLGTVLHAEGDLSAALSQYRARQMIVLSLHTLDPNHTVWHRDYARSYGTIGDVLGALGDAAGASAAYRKFAALAELLAAQDSNNVEWQRDLAGSQQKLGDHLAAHGDLDGAAAAYRRLGEITARLALLDPGNAQYQRDLAAARSRLAMLLEKEAKFGEAADLQNRAAEALEALANKLGTEPARWDAGNAWGKLAWYYLLWRQPGKAVEAAQRGSRFAPTDLGVMLNLAHALLVSGNAREAERIYRRQRQATLDGGRSWDQAADDNIRTLIARGIVHPEMRRIEKGLRAGR